MNYTRCLLLFLLLSGLLPAQGILRNSVAALNYPGAYPLPIMRHRRRVKGKDIANSNYNPNACQSALLSGGVGTGLNPAGDAAVGMYCNEAVPSTERKVGLVLMVAGGPVSLLGFLLHRR